MPPRRRPREGIQQDRHWYRLPVGAEVHDHVVSHGQALLTTDADRHTLSPSMPLLNAVTDHCPLATGHWPLATGH